MIAIVLSRGFMKFQQSALTKNTLSHSGLSTWENTWNTAENKPKSLSAPKGPWKAALLSGPPGIGEFVFSLHVMS